MLQVPWTQWSCEARVCCVGWWQLTRNSSENLQDPFAHRFSVCWVFPVTSLDPKMLQVSMTSHFCSIFLNHSAHHPLPTSCPSDKSLFFLQNLNHVSIAWGRVLYPSFQTQLIWCSICTLDLFYHLYLFVFVSFSLPWVSWRHELCISCLLPQWI